MFVNISVPFFNLRYAMTCTYNLSSLLLAVVELLSFYKEVLAIIVLGYLSLLLLFVLKQCR